MLQSQKYLQVCNSLKCPSNHPIKLAALQIKWCLPSIITPLVSPAQEITRFQASENEIIGINSASVKFQTQWYRNLNQDSRLTPNLGQIYY